MNRLEELLRSDIREVEAKLALAEEECRTLKIQRDALRSVLDRSGSKPLPQESRDIIDSPSPGSFVIAAMQIIQESGKAMAIRDLASQAIARKWLGTDHKKVAAGFATALNRSNEDPNGTVKRVSHGLYDLATRIDKQEEKASH